MARPTTANPRGRGGYDIGWMGSNWPYPLPTVPAAAPPSPAFMPLQPGASRPTYDLAGTAGFLGAWWNIPQKADLNLLVKLRESIPLLSGAILRMKQLVGWPDVEASPRIKRDIETFLRMLPNCRVQYGARSWGQTHLDNCFTFGRAHTEVLLTATRRDIHSLVEVDPRTTAFGVSPGGYALPVRQWQYGGGLPVELPSELTITTVNDLRGDDPNGTSMIGDLPFVSEIYTKMLRSLGATWDRFGVPTYHVNWEPPLDWNDPNGAQTAAIMAPMQSNLQTALLNRANGKVSDFFTSGKVTVAILGAAGETLEFSENARTIAEQMCARWGIPPFMFGFSWASTERMSTAQAKAVTEIIDNLRDMAEPGIHQLIDLWLRITGRSGKFSLKWEHVSLIDLIDTSRAEWMDQQALALRLENKKEEARLGVISVEEMAQCLRDDLEGLSADEVRERLPNLVKEVPQPDQIQIASMSNAAIPGGNNPRDEAMKALMADEWQRAISCLESPTYGH